MRPQRSEEDFESLGTGVIGGYEVPRGCTEAKSESSVNTVKLTTEAPFQPASSSFFPFKT